MNFSHRGTVSKDDKTPLTLEMRVIALEKRVEALDHQPTFDDSTRKWRPEDSGSGKSKEQLLAEKAEREAAQSDDTETFDEPLDVTAPLGASSVADVETEKPLTPASTPA